jgi:hypothetical protein
MSTLEEGEVAKTALNGTEIDGRVVNVDNAREQAEVGCGQQPAALEWGITWRSRKAKEGTRYSRIRSRIAI